MSKKYFLTSKTHKEYKTVREVFMKRLKILLIVFMLVPVMVFMTACGKAGAKGPHGDQGIPGIPGPAGPKGETGTATKPDTYLWLGETLIVIDGETGSIKSMTNLASLELVDGRLGIISLGSTSIGVDTDTGDIAEIKYENHVTKDFDIQFFVVGSRAYVFEYTKVQTGPYTYKFDYAFADSYNFNPTKWDTKGKVTEGYFRLYQYFYVYKNGTLVEKLDVSEPIENLDATLMGYSDDYGANIYYAVYQNRVIFVNTDSYIVAIAEIREIAGTKFFEFRSYNDDTTFTVFVIKEGDFAVCGSYYEDDFDITFFICNGKAYINEGGTWSPFAYPVMEISEDIDLFGFLYEGYAFGFYPDSDEFMYIGYIALQVATMDDYGFPVREFIIANDIVYFFYNGIFEIAVDLNDELVMFTTFSTDWTCFEYDSLIYIFYQGGFDRITEVIQIGGIKIFEFGIHPSMYVYVIEDDDTYTETIWKQISAGKMYFFIFEGKAYVYDSDREGCGYVEQAFAIYYGDDWSVFVYNGIVYFLDDGSFDGTDELFEAEDIRYFEFYFESEDYFKAYVVDNDGTVIAEYIQWNIGGIYFFVHNDAAYVVYAYVDFVHEKYEIVDNEFAYGSQTFEYVEDAWRVKA